MQSARGRALLRGHGLDPDNPASFLLLDEAGAWTDSDAVVRILHALGGPWRLAARLLRWLPAAPRDRAYRLVARNRYRWFGTTACHVPTHAERARFLD